MEKMSENMGDDEDQSLIPVTVWWVFVVGYKFHPGSFWQ